MFDPAFEPTEEFVLNAAYRANSLLGEDDVSDDEECTGQISAWADMCVEKGMDAFLETNYVNRLLKRGLSLEEIKLRSVIIGDDATAGFVDEIRNKNEQ